MGTQLPYQKGGKAPNFRPISIVAKRVGLFPGHTVLEGDLAPPKKGHSPLQFSDLFYCGQTAGWIKMPLGTEVGIGAGDIVLYRDPATPP